MKNTGGNNSTAPPEKKLKQGTVLSFFSAAKVRNENARKRKLSQNDEDIQVLKVRCGEDNKDTPKGALKVSTKENSEDKETKPEAKDVQKEEIIKPTVVEDLDIDSAEEAKEDGDSEDEKKSDEVVKEDSAEDSNDSKKDDKSEVEKEDEESVSLKSESEEDDLTSANTSLNQSGFNSSLMEVNDSINSISDIPITPMKETPKVRKLTPKQVQRQVESQKRKEAKEKEKEDREMKKQQEKEERQKQREERERLKNQERLDRQKKKQAEIDQKNEEKKAKEEEKRRQEEKKLEDKKKKEEEKVKEKQKREEEKLQKEQEKKKAEEEEKKKQEKTVAAFVSFFKKPATEPSKPTEEKDPISNNFMPFTLKKGMKLAPTTRHLLESTEKSAMEQQLELQSAKKLYVQMLKEKLTVPKKSGKTFAANEKGASGDDGDDVVVLEEESEDEAEKVGEIVVTNTMPEKNVKPVRAKLLHFCENRRPAYWGTWSKKSTSVTARKPLGQDKMFDYEVDSDEEWEEEEPGESLHGSDDDKESEDEDYDVDNDMFVPHGYLSDEEAGNSEDEALPAEEQKERLKQLELEFKEDMKKKVKKLTPRMVSCFNCNDPVKADDPVHSQVIRLLEQFAAVVVADKILTSFNSEKVECDNLESDPIDDLNTSMKAEGSAKKRNKMRVPDEAIPDLIRLLHGNTKNRQYLVKEFITFWDKKTHPEADVESEVEHSRTLISMGNCSKVIKELASWQACPDEGPFQGRLCWWVIKEEREKHNLTDLPLPNPWVYIVKPAARRARAPKVVPPAADKPEAVKVAVVDDEVEAAADPMVAETPPKSAKENLITKFTKVLSAEEMQKQLEAEKAKAKEKKEQEAAAKLASSPFSASSAFFLKNNPSTSKPDEVKTSTPTSASKPNPAADQKKGRRVSLMFSVPRGQTIPSTRPVPEGAPPAFNPVATTGTKDEDDDCQVLEEKN